MAQGDRPVKCSVPLDVGTHSRLAALASLRRMSAGALAAEFIADGLRGQVVVIDRRKPAVEEGPACQEESSASDAA